jgi:MFS transporter, ACS family, glucarate transporter
MATQVSPRTRAAEQPSRVRYWVIFFAVTLAIITYIDRVCISQAAPFMMKDLGLTQVQMGWAFSAFAIAYALFEIPGGFLGDWMGPRKVLMRIVVWWSFFTAATGWVWNFSTLIVTRAMFGAGEAGCFPNLTKAFTAWLTPDERVRAQGIMWLSARWGGAFTPLIVVVIFNYMSWRRAFEIFGLIGVVWAFFFYRWFRDRPSDKPEVNAAERALLAPNEHLVQGHAHVPWGKFFSSRQVWMLCMQYFFLSYGWYFYITWLPTYLEQGRGLSLGKTAMLSILPLFLGGIGSFFSGFVSKPITRTTGSVTATRRLMAYTGFTGASLMILVAIRFENPLYTMIGMGLASFCNDLVMPGAWGACMDVGGKYAGTLSGAMNMAGNIGGALCPIAIGYILSWTDNNWDIAFYASAATYFAGSIFWALLDPVTPLEQSERPAVQTA